MDVRKLAVGFVSLALLVGAGACALARPGQPAGQVQLKADGEENDDEQVITLDKAPAAVRAAALKLAADAKNITKVSREEDDEDVVTFEVEYNEGATKCAAIFSTAGELMESEKGTTEAKLPAAALAALKKEYPKATFADPQIVTKTFYEIVVVIDGQKHAVTVDAAGGIEDESEGGDEHAKQDEGAEKNEKDEKDEKHGQTERGAAAGDDGWRTAFAVNRADLAPTGASAYFVLQPGHTLTYAGDDVVLVITVLDETRVVDGVTTRVVEERETKAGVLVEVSRNYFAIEPKTGDTYYFGEDVDIYKDGKVVKHEGEWASGKDGARFGLFIPGAPQLGDKFYQEAAPGRALDRFEIVSLTERLETPAGAFDKALKAEETTPLEAGKGYKWFAPGVGLVRDGDLKLTKIKAAPGQK
jgi:hypothetical protein